MKAQWHANGLEWNVNDNGLVQTAKIFDPTGISSYPDVYYAYKDMWLQEKGPLQIWDLIY
jgi:hypothetical protein